MVYTFKENLAKLPHGEECALQMDLTLLMNIDGDRNVMQMDEVNPNHWGFDSRSYRAFSSNSSGWNTHTNCYHLEAKTWFYKLIIKVKTDNFFIKNTWVHGDLLEINQTYNTGDEIHLYMVRQIEFKANSSSDCDIIAYYIPPFVNPWDIKEGEDVKKNYLIKYQIHSIGKYIIFQNGLYKFVVDDSLSALLNDKKTLNKLILKNWTDIYGKEQNKFYYLKKEVLADWFNEEE